MVKLLKVTRFFTSAFTVCLSSFIFLALTTSNLHAQCTGTATCGSRVDTVCTDSGGNTCLPPASGCTCVDQCNGLSTAISCGGYSPPSACSASSICETIVGVCTKSGSCSYSAPPSTGPTCGNGTCESGETAASCPADCSSGSGSCSGDCFGGIANCGLVGKVPGSGTCPTPGELCCQSSGGGACTPSFQGNWDGVQGTSKTVRVYNAGGISNWRGELMWKTMYANSPNLGGFSPNPDPSGATYSYVFTPLNVGSSTIRFTAYSDWVNWDTGTKMCTGYKSIRVYPRPVGTPPTASLWINGRADPATVSPGTTIQLRWSSYAPPSDPATCVAKGDWSGTKATPTGNENVTINSPSTFTIECTNSVGTAIDTVDVFIPGPQSCSIWTSASSPVTVEIGRNSPTIPVDNIVTNNGIITKIDFTPEDSSNVYEIIPPTTDSAAPYEARVRGLNPGWKYLNFTATMNNGSTTCTNHVGIRVIRWVCSLPTPYDPPTPICESSPGAGDGSVTWEWGAVEGATEYQVDIVNNATNALVVDNDFILASDPRFGPNCDVVGGICRYTTSGMTEGEYISEITARGVCDDSATAVSDPITVPLCADCDISITPDPVSAVVGNPPSLVTIATNSIQGGSISSVDWSSANPARATVSPATDSSSPFTTNVTGVTIGNTTLTANAYMNGDTSAPVCTDAVSVSADSPNAWWQVLEGTVVTNGAIRSEVPGSCVLPACIDYFIANTPGGYPGIAAYGTNADFASGPSTGNVSSKGWQSNTLYSGAGYSYSYFYNLASGKQITNIGGTLSNATLAGATTDPDGYTWIHATGDVAVNSNLNINRKVVLFVENGNFTINARITLSNPDNDFFMVVAGKDNSGNKGDIVVAPSVSGSGINPALEGIYFADGKFATGSGNTQLLVHGAVASYGGIVLDRDLNNDNVDTPAEGFIYAPEIYLNYPTALSTKHLVWQETSP